jgi:nitrite reductase (NADH) large subunit
LSEAVGGGCSTVEELSACTGAASGCGSCRPLLAQLLAAPQPQTAHISARWLLWLSGAAVLVALWLLLPGSIPYAKSITTLPYDLLWRDGFYKQLSGYSLLGLSALASLLAARKRLRGVRLGDFAWWRVLHVALGLLCLTALLVHTGGRLGSGLNFTLSMFFLAPVLLGAVAGNVIAKEHRLGASGVAERRRWVWLHILLLWPLPVLLACHVLQGYLF